MNILLITPSWGHLGGLERYVVDCVQEFTRMGHVCSVVYGYKSDRPVEKDIASRLNGTYHIGPLSRFETRQDSAAVAQLDAILETVRPETIFMTGVRNFALLARLESHG